MGKEMLPHPEDNQILSYATLEMLILLGWMGYIHIIFLLYYISYNYILRISYIYEAKWENKLD